MSVERRQRTSADAGRGGACLVGLALPSLPFASRLRNDSGLIRQRPATLRLFALFRARLGKNAIHGIGRVGSHNVCVGFLLLN